MSISASYRAELTVRETIATGVDSSSNPVIVHDAFNQSKSVSATTTVPGTKVVAKTLTLSGGAYTIDLTSMTGTNGAAVDFTNLKVQSILFYNPSSASITFTFGASTPYLALGTGWKFILPAGASLVYYVPDLAADVDSTHKMIDVTGTGSDTFDIVIIAG